MSTYIDLELALNELLRLYEEDVDAYGVEIPETFDYRRAREALQSLPTIDIVHCKGCIQCEQDLIVERTRDGYERKINLCHVSKPPKVVEPHHYCGYGNEVRNE